MKDEEDGQFLRLQHQRSHRVDDANIAGRALRQSGRSAAWQLRTLNVVQELQKDLEGGCPGELEKANCHHTWNFDVLLHLLKDPGSAGGLGGFSGAGDLGKGGSDIASARVGGDGGQVNLGDLRGLDMGRESAVSLITTDTTAPYIELTAAQARGSRAVLSASPELRWASRMCPRSMFR